MQTIAILICSAAPASWPQDASSDPGALVRRAIQHRQEGERLHQPMRYLLRKQEDGRETVKAIIETKDGDVAKLVEIDGKPLSAEQEQHERQRLSTLAAHPELEEKRQRAETGDRKRISDLLDLLPEGLVYKFEGEAPCGTRRCWRLNFSRRPGWDPPTLEADVLRAVSGEMLIDRQKEVLVRLDAAFIADASFGLGILGRIDKGGTASLQQDDIGAGDWELTSLVVNLKGKALMFKAINVNLTEGTSRYEVVPAMGYREAIRLLEK